MSGVKYFLLLHVGTAVPNMVDTGHRQRSCLCQVSIVEEFDGESYTCSTVELNRVGKKGIMICPTPWCVTPNAVQCYQ
jgi:hypothetical protein